MTLFPPAFETGMRAVLADDWKSFAEVHGQEAPVSIRVNPRKRSNSPVRRIPWTQYGYYLEQRPSFTLDPLFHAGAYYVQDASSMFLEQALRQCVDLDQPVRILDLCAAPGGKSTHLVSLMNENSLLVANEVIGSRATILSENIQKWGYPNVVVTNNDPADFDRIPSYFDAIVVDAPCSGEGLFRKDPQAMREWSPEAVTLCSQRQRRILHDVWPSLKQGGILIYCTCTYNEKENEDTLDWLALHKGLESLPLKTDPAWNIHSITKHGISGYHFYPHRTEGEGFFLAVVQKTETGSEFRNRVKNGFITPPKKAADELRTWVRDPSAVQFINHGELVLLIPAGMQPDIELLSGKVKIVSRGTAVATQKHDKWIPEHSLAVSTVIDKEKFNPYSLTTEQAIAYLRRESPLLPSTGRGFALVTYQDTPLGWINQLEKRINNLYPAAWRIRM